MPLKYQSGEEIRAGDRVMLHAEPGEIEYVVDGLSGDPAKDWNFEQNSQGVMVLEPKFFGRAYIRAPHAHEDLVFVGRQATRYQVYRTAFAASPLIT